MTFYLFGAREGRLEIPNEDDDETFTRAERGPTTADAKLPTREIAKQDILIERPDLGANVRTRVNRGEQIPLGLEKYPRHAI
jgi:hypothetical protein